MDSRRSCHELLSAVDVAPVTAGSDTRWRTAAATASAP
jgi:hypothetical protein